MSIVSNRAPPNPAVMRASIAQIDIFVGKGFCGHEVSTIARTLDCANDVLGIRAFRWRYISETPGLLNGAHGMILRAEPAVADHHLADILFVVGGRSGRDAQWLARMRQMARLARPCVLLSDAATSYIKRTKSPSGNVTTHWRDAAALAEAQTHPRLSNRLAERSGNVITAAGGGATAELVIELISPQLKPADLAELGNRLLLPVMRKAYADQPKDITSLPALSDTRLKAAVTAMEESLDAPFNINELSRKIGVSTRHLERLFKSVFELTPARFYKQLRTKRARALIEETQMPMIEVAIATGFGSGSSLNEAIKQEYGLTASQMRKR